MKNNDFFRGLLILYISFKKQKFLEKKKGKINKVYCTVGIKCGASCVQRF